MRTALSLLLAAAVTSPVAGQAQWTLKSTLIAPSSPRGTAMAFDTLRGRAVLFGGCEVDYPFHAIIGASAATWEWDGRDWLPRSPATAPSARFYHSMVYDPARRRVILFGGRDAGGLNPGDTTWEYDGNNWSNVTPATGPVPREVAAMAYDEARQHVVLFGGGFAGDSTKLSDTWTWNGAQWTQRFPQQVPSGRFGHAMDYDPIGSRVIMFGGVGHGGYTNDLWQWDGSNWTQLVSSTASPQPRHYHALAFDPTHNELLLFGGAPGQPQLDDTWVWQNNAWTQAAPAPAPTARSHPAVVFDSVRRQFVLFGGRDWISGPYGNINDTWTYHTDEAWFATFGSGCAGAQGTPALACAPGREPVLGGPFTLLITALPTPHASLVASMGDSISTTGSALLPRDLTESGLPGCTQWVNTITDRPLHGGAGVARWNMAIPNHPSLLGRTSYFQATVLDPTAPPPNIGYTVSNAAAATIGR